jgi:hypothetical protein
MPGGGGFDSSQSQFSAQMKNYGKQPHLSKLEVHAEHVAELNKLKTRQAINSLNKMPRYLLIMLDCRDINLTKAVSVFAFP